MQTGHFLHVHRWTLLLLLCRLSNVYIVQSALLSSCIIGLKTLVLVVVHLDL